MYSLYFDGASRGNPGLASFGGVIYDEDGHEAINYKKKLGIETNKSKAAERFIDTCDLDMETLKLKAVVKDATFFRFISLKTDGMLYHSATSTMLGRNVADVVIYLKNPVNEDILISILQEVESFWNE